ncbi:MAG: helix-turn-helix domain-containing protein [Clostridia bacterium]|nr:helix-turn-helix domain-containing protein [Clostridia bacterium]
MDSKLSKRTQLMLKNFINLRSKGLSIAEIAEKYGLSTHTIYNRLQEIADQNGVERSALLDIVHKPHIITNRKDSNYSSTSVEELISICSSSKMKLYSLIEKVQECVEGEKNA